MLWYPRLGPQVAFQALTIECRRNFVGSPADTVDAYLEAAAVRNAHWTEADKCPRVSRIVIVGQKSRTGLYLDNHDRATLFVDGKTETAMQQQYKYVHIVGLEAAADTDPASRALHQNLAFIVAVELVGGFRQRLLIEDQDATAPA